MARTLERLVRTVRRFPRVRRIVRRNQVGQALALVSGVMLILTLGGAILVQSFGEQTPIVQSDLIQHPGLSRAVEEAGLDEYLYRANVNADYVICNSANDTTGFCPGLNFETWIPVEGSSSSSGPPSWFYLNNPTLNYNTGVESRSKWKGRPASPRHYSYQTATVNLEPLNNFLPRPAADQLQPDRPGRARSHWHALNCSWYWR